MGDLSKHFNRREFACKCGCGDDSVDYQTVVELEDVREHFGARIDISSAYRCLRHNNKPVSEGGVGSNSASQHPRARAVDFTVEGIGPPEVQAYLKLKHPGKYGIGSYSKFTHLDTRTNGPARWDG